MPERIRSAAELGTALARAREANGLSQRELAETLGISQRYVVEMEAGKPSLYSDRLFACIGLLGIELEASLPRPDERLGVVPVLWPRTATPADAPALHAIDPRRGIEEYTALASDPGRRLLVVPVRIDWPRGRPPRLRIEPGVEHLGALAGYGLDGELVVPPGPHAEAIRDALRLSFGGR